VAIGNADFKNMEKLDNDDMSMVDSQGRKAKRDLVQFVPFNEFKANSELLAKNVLEELPDQLVEYM
jgi:Copine